MIFQFQLLQLFNGEGGVPNLMVNGMSTTGAQAGATFVHPAAAQCNGAFSPFASCCYLLRWGGGWTREQTVKLWDIFKRSNCFEQPFHLRSWLFPFTCANFANRVRTRGMISRRFSHPGHLRSIWKENLFICRNFVLHQYPPTPLR